MKYTIHLFCHSKTHPKNKMTVLTMIKQFTDKIVIVDDGYKPIDPTLCDGEDAAKFNAQADMQKWKALQASHFQDCARPGDLIGNEIALRAAWKIYDADPDNYKIFEPLFDSLVSSRNQKLQRLTPFVEYLTNTVGLTVITHPDVVSASDDIRQCKLIFLDFYLKQGTVNDMLSAIEPFHELFSSKTTATNEPRFIFLMSSQLPVSTDLDKFRRITQLKAAFFKPISKDLLTQSWFEKEMSSRITSYPEMIKLSSFLDTFSSTIGSVANLLQSDIDSLELHDLTVLHTIRLQLEKEKLGHYLAWLFSEALAAKIRESAPLLEASKDVDGINQLPFVGLLEPQPLLFNLFSEVTFSYPDEINISESARFGDVYARIPVQTIDDKSEEELTQVLTAIALDSRSENVSAAMSVNEVTDVGDKHSTSENSALEYVAGDSQANTHSSLNSGSSEENCSMQDELAIAPVLPVVVDSQTLSCVEELLLVISPACDLIRCTEKYEVLCVRGHIMKTVPRLSDLFDQKNVFGKNRHLMRSIKDGITVYMLVDWKEKEVTTIPISELNKSSSYKKHARLNELFCHEVKENVLRQLGRVGLPVDPSFTTALSAAVRIRTNGSHEILLAPQNTFVSGIKLAGNNLNDKRVILSQEFRDWFNSEATRLVSEKGALPKVAKLLEHLNAQGGLEFPLQKKTECSIASGVGKLKYFDKYSEDEFTHDYEIIVYPRDAMVFDL